MKINAKLWPAAIAAGILLTIGCGGGTGGSALPNIYTNQWTGSWSAPIESDSGTITLQVFNDGSITGTMTRKSSGTGAVSGTVTQDGHFQAIVGFGASGNFTMNGTMVLNNNMLDGAFSYTFLGYQYSGSFACTAGSGGTTGH